MKFIKNNLKKLIGILVVIAVLVFAYWYGGNAPGTKGFRSEEKSAPSTEQFSEGTTGVLDETVEAEKASKSDNNEETKQDMSGDSDNPDNVSTSGNGDTSNKQETVDVSENDSGYDGDAAGDNNTTETYIDGNGETDSSEAGEKTDGNSSDGDNTGGNKSGHSSDDGNGGNDKSNRNQGNEDGNRTEDNKSDDNDSKNNNSDDNGSGNGNSGGAGSGNDNSGDAGSGNGNSSGNSSENGNSGDKSDTGSENTTEAEEDKPSSHQKCTISIACNTILNNMSMLDKSKRSIIPADGWILKTVTVEFTTGETVFEVLERVTKQHGIQMEYSYTPLYGSYYIEGIYNLYEFDCGNLSGWMYSVNGSFPNFGCSKYVLKDGDVIEWVYTCDLGEDVGNPY